MEGRHELADLAPRDVVARAILETMREQGTDHVFLDARHLGAAFLEQRFPSIVASLPVAGLRPGDRPAAGGPGPALRVRRDRAPTSRAAPPSTGLYACGECSCTGVHGANRLASNSLLEGLVFASRIATTSPRGSPPVSCPRSQCRPLRRTPVVRRGPGRPAGQLATPHRAAGDDGRRRARCAPPSRPPRPLEAWPTSRPCRRRPPKPGPRTWETTNLLHLGQALTELARRREETRGGHVRSDFPDRDDARWLVPPERRRRTRPIPHRDRTEYAVSSPSPSDLAFPEAEARRVVSGALDEDLGGPTASTSRRRRRSPRPADARRGRGAGGRRRRRRGRHRPRPSTRWPARLGAEPVVGDARRRRRGPGRARRRRRRAVRLDAGDARRRAHHAQHPLPTLGRRHPHAPVGRRPRGLGRDGPRHAQDHARGCGVLEKFAVRAGGGTNKRMGLHDVAMIKDNHKLAAGVSPRHTPPSASSSPRCRSRSR